MRARVQPETTRCAAPVPRQRDPGFRVIPVLLPGADLNALLDLKSFFDSTHWIDFRKDLQDRTAIGGLAGFQRALKCADGQTVRQRIARERGRTVVRSTKQMKKITLRLTAEELQALVTLSENQFFRLKYIDPKMPGYKVHPEELRAAQSAVQVLQDALKKEKGFKVALLVSS